MCELNLHFPSPFSSFSDLYLAKDDVCDANCTVYVGFSLSFFPKCMCAFIGLFSWCNFIEEHEKTYATFSECMRCLSRRKNNNCKLNSMNAFLLNMNYAIGTCKQSKITNRQMILKKSVYTKKKLFYSVRMSKLKN